MGNLLYNLFNIVSKKILDPVVLGGVNRSLFKVLKVHLEGLDMFRYSVLDRYGVWSWVWV